MVVTGTGSERQLAAFLTRHGSRAVSGTMIRDWLATRLPDYMIPARILELPAFPLNSSGKIDRAALVVTGQASETVSNGEETPMTELERRLAGIWQEVLGRPYIGRDDDFFALGGHSLQAMRVAAAVEDLYGQRFSVAVLLRARTVRDLAGWLEESSSQPRWNSLVPLQPRGTLPPLYFVHGWGGDIYVFLDLVRHLPTNRPVYGIQAVGLDGELPRHESVDAMAAYYADQVIDFQPEGPYYLVGYSLGGTFAFEVARQLEFRGARVAFIAMLN